MENMRQNSQLAIKLFATTAYARESRQESLTPRETPVA